MKMTNVQMKGITCCADCAYYNLKKHHCTRAQDEGDARSHFYADCPLPDVIPVESQPRPMRYEELKGIYNFRDNHSWVYDTPPYLYFEELGCAGYWIAWSNVVSCLEGRFSKYTQENYAIKWRCWTSRPTDEQRREEKWEG